MIGAALSIHVGIENPKTIPLLMYSKINYTLRCEQFESKLWNNNDKYIRMNIYNSNILFIKPFFTLIQIKLNGGHPFQTPNHISLKLKRLNEIEKHFIIKTN